MLPSESSKNSRLALLLGLTAESQNVLDQVFGAPAGLKDFFHRCFDLNAALIVSDQSIWLKYKINSK